jgi:asparagine synthetase B (glutamine-hydrolysing)
MKTTKMIGIVKKPQHFQTAMTRLFEHRIPDEGDDTANRGHVSYSFAEVRLVVVDASQWQQESYVEDDGGVDAKSQQK